MKQFGLATVGSVLLSTGVMAEGSDNEKVTYEVFQNRVTLFGQVKK